MNHQKDLGIIRFFSNINGYGVKAQTNFNPGEVVVTFTGEPITLVTANQLYDQGFDYLLQISPQAFLKLNNDCKYINHSCSPNCAFLNNNGELVALKPIHQGEEITFDYSANEDTDFQLKCLCLQPNCRQTILPFHKNSSIVQQQLLPLLSPYLRALYLRGPK